MLRGGRNTEWVLFPWDVTQSYTAKILSKEILVLKKDNHTLVENTGSTKVANVRTRSAVFLAWACRSLSFHCSTVLQHLVTASILGLPHSEEGTAGSGRNHSWGAGLGYTVFLVSLSRMKISIFPHGICCHPCLWCIRTETLLFLPWIGNFFLTEF